MTGRLRVIYSFSREIYLSSLNPVIKTLIHTIDNIKKSQTVTITVVTNLSSSFYLRRFSESRSSSGSTPSVRPSVCLFVCPSVRPSVRNTFGVHSLCNL